MKEIMAIAGAPVVEELWKQLTKEEDRLWLTWPTGEYTL
jgi:hypothetical protein